MWGITNKRSYGANIDVSVICTWRVIHKTTLTDFNEFLRKIPFRKMHCVIM